MKHFDADNDDIIVGILGSWRASVTLRIVQACHPSA